MLRPFLSKLKSTSTFLFSNCRLKTPDQFTSSLRFSPEYNEIETFALTNVNGNLHPGIEIENSEKEMLKKVYRLIDEMEVIDDFMNKAQRQGRNSKVRIIKRKNIILHDKFGRNRVHFGNCIGLENLRYYLLPVSRNVIFVLPRLLHKRNNRQLHWKPQR